MAVIGKLLGAEDLPLTQTASSQLIQDYIAHLRFDDRTAEIIKVIENYPVAHGIAPT
jgi:hypothetical protein